MSALHGVRIGGIDMAVSGRCAATASERFGRNKVSIALHMIAALAGL